MVPKVSAAASTQILPLRLWPSRLHRHQRGEREGWPRQRPHGQRHQRDRIIVAGDTIAIQHTATEALVHQGPFAVGARRDRQRFHNAATVSGPVSRFSIEVTTPETDMTMVPMARTGSGPRNRKVTMPASEGAVMRLGRHEK